MEGVPQSIKLLKLNNNYFRGDKLSLNSLLI